MSKVEDVYGLTPLQQAMFVRALMEPESSAYVEQLRIELAACPDPDALRQAWADLYARHPALRTSFHHAGLSDPQQVVHRTGALPWRVEDRRDGADVDIDAIARQDREKGFDLSRPPLWRVVLVLLPDSAVLVWTFHHLLLDGWSLGRVLVEIERGYRSACEGTAGSLPPAPPFREYVTWLRAMDGRPADAYWRTRLAGAVATPVDGPAGGTGGERRIMLDSAATERIRTVCQSRAITLGTLATAAWAAALAESGGIQDITFTSLLSGRPAELPGVDEIVGMLVNTVATRVRFEPGETVHALLQRVQEDLVQDRTHGWSSLDTVSRATGLASPESVLVIENYPLDQALLGDSRLQVRSIAVHEQADVPLVVAIVPGNDLELRLAAPPGGLTAAALDGLGASLARWLLTLAEGMDDEVAELLGRGERGAQEDLRARIRQDAPRAGSLVEAILAAGPTVIDGADHWSAAQVLAEAERFARAAYSAPEGPVALVADTHARTVAQMFGCLRVGRTYVPLDRSDPRHADRMAHAGAREIAQGDPQGSELPPLPAPATLAYLLYTSGTTGTPKAVRQTHDGVYQHALRFAASIGLGPSDRVCMTASFAFDAAVMDIYATAVVGATLLIGSPKRHGLKALREDILPQATVLHTTPSLFRLLAADGLPGGLRAVVLGGEAALPSDLELFTRTAPTGCVLVNGFGPSESTTGLQWFAERGVRLPAVPIGLPVAGTDVWLCDEDGERVDGAWASGDIVLASEAVAHGYHGDAEADGRFGQEGGRRFYRTGDLGRRRPSGCLDIVRRADDQVQIGGVRVEPAEVRAALAALPGVAAAEVLATGEGAGVRLRAWVTPVGRRHLDAAVLLPALAAELPPAFVPSSLHVLDELPLLANGKVDRAALRARTTDGALTPAEPSASRDPADPVLAAVLEAFAEVTGKTVEPDQNLFALGANSLDALRVTGRLEKRLSRHVPLQLVFDHSTPRELAAAVAAGPGRKPADAVPRTERRWRTRGGAKPAARSDQAPALSLFFFSGSGEDPAQSYQLLLDASLRADALGLEAVWTPERHFDEFGGPYPNPSVLGAYLAARTRNIRLRAGSVVLPLHDVARVAEEWAVVDQLSGGRVDLAIASGWHRRDFVLGRDRYDERKARLPEQIDQLRRLWAGEAVEFSDAEGSTTEVRTWPRPVQPALPLWLTSQAPETFELAGRHGFNVLTNLNYKSMDELSERAALYRRARGSRPGGRVTVMTHTLVGKDGADTRTAAVEAYADYARSNLLLQRAHARGVDRDLRPSEADARILALRSAERMVEGGGLVGDLDQCRERLAELRAAGADEVACLIDFGASSERVLEGVELLGELATPTATAHRSGKRVAVLPAAPLQAQLWLLENLSDTPGTWMIPTIVRVEGALDTELLTSRLAALCVRHEALRTSLEEQDGRIVQIVWEDRTARLEIRPVASESDALRQARDVLDEGLDLSRAPLLRAVLFAVDPTHHVLLLACHHAIADGSSTVALARELFDGVPGDLPLQLGDWAAWMEDRVERGDLEAEETWWDEALTDLPPRLRLGSGRPDGRRAVHPVPIDSAVETGLRAACESSGATLFETVLAGFTRAVARTTGRDDFLIGLHHANRDRPELEGLVGPLVNLLPFRVRLPSSDVLAGVRDQARAALAHHEVPYSRIVARHATEHRVGTDPLIDAALVYQNLPDVTSESPVRWTRIELEGGRARFPLTLVATERQGGLALQLELDAGMFTEEDAARLTAAVRESLYGLAGLDAPARARVESEPAVAMPGAHLLAPFLDHAERHPGDTAVVGPEGSLTRSELRAGARRLAGAIRARVPAGTRVGVQVEPGCATLVAVYGVLLADCTVVPLDARNPASRREVELRLAEVELAVAHADLEVPRLDPYQTGPEWVQEPSGKELAYLIFTSGSTGVPKPVAVGHDSVRALIGWARTEFSEEELSGTLLTAPIRFDMSVFGLYVPLAGPGSVVVVRDLAALVDGPPPAPVSLVYTVPSALRALLGAGALPRTVRTVNLGGEALPADLVATLLDRVDRVCNLYGPTESTSNAFFEDYTQPAEPTIGRPITGTGAWIRRIPDGTCAETGETGELVLTGAGLALGYLGSPGHPAFTPEGYRTGDRAYLAPDGRFVYQGRLDDQVKVRGHRVQLAEIDAHLSSLTGVSAGASRLDGDLIEAWIVPSAGCARAAQADARQAQAWAVELGRVLPAFLLPSRWILVEELPLTAHGKLDRKGLDAIEWSALAAATLDNPAQAELAAVWEEVLGVPVPDADADFFALGGHSLLAITLSRRIEDRWNVRVPLRTLFDHPTVAALEVALRDAEPTRPDAAPLVEDPSAAGEPFPLTELQQAYWVGGRDGMDLGSVGTQGYVEVDTTVPVDRLTDAFRTLVRRHDMLRAVFEPDGRQRVLADPGEFPIVVEDLRDAPESELAARREERSHHRPDPANWPLVRVWVSRLADRSRVHMSVPALIADAHSVYLLTRELTTLIEGRELAPAGPAYRDLAVALAERDRTSDDAEFASRAGTFPAGPQLPLAANPEQLHSVRFRRGQVRLEPEVWQAVKDAGAAHGLTPAGMLLSVFGWVLQAWSEEPEFTLGVTFFDRPALHPDVDRVVGDFTSARLVEMGQAADLGQFATLVQGRLWEALDGSVFDAVRCVRTLRRLGRPHTFPIVFTSTLGLESPKRGSLGEVAYALTQTSQVWLDHKVREEDGGLVSTWDFVEGLFRPGVVEAMMERFEAVLRDLPANGWPTAFPGLPDDQQRVRRAHGSAPWTPSGPALLHETLLADPDADSDEPALMTPEGEQVTRRELAAAAGAVARRLLDEGLRVSDMVAVDSRHGWRQAAAALGVLAAGGAFVPIDPAWPQLRIEAVLETAGARCAVAPEGWGADLRHIPLHDDDRAAPLEPLPGRAGPEDLAYVLFTSGSTGTPKGVEITHAAAMNTLADIGDRFALHGERVLGLAGLHFDLSIFDLFGSWLTGGAVVHPEIARDPASWVERMAAEGVTVWNSVPALAEMLVEHLEATGQRLPVLRLVMLSGDWIPVTLADRLRAVAPSCRVVSLGGATEGSIWSIAHEIGSHDPAWPSVPYGRPLRNQGMHVLDAARNPRPDWVTGEIHISGRGVARGYRGDPVRTSAVFWHDPRTGEPYYATGDLGRFRPDGTIEFLGRRDGQVKVRGHRIELGEIEATALEHPAVRQIAVTAPKGPSGHRHLVAHVVGDVDEAAVRAHLAERLPDAHVPRRIHLVDALALTANGKIDRAVLSTPPPIPAAPVSEALLTLFREVLEQPEAGFDDDFFALGGDSVLAIRMLSRVEAELGRRLPIRQVFADPTPRGLSALLETEQPRSTVSLDPEARKRAKERQGRPELDGPARLLPPAAPSASLSSRRSHRDFAPEPVPAEAVERLLALLGVHEGNHLYPSAGGANGVHAYLQVADGRVDGLDGSWFVDGRLVRVSDAPWDPGTADAPPNTGLSRGAAFAVVLVADLDTLEPLYGENSGHLATLEAGYMGQLLAGEAAAFDLSLCPIGAVGVPSLLDSALLLGPRRRVLHVLLGGRSLASRISADTVWSGTVAEPRQGPAPVLLTGAAGVLGSALLAELLEQGREVHCLLRGDADARLAGLLRAEGVEHCADRAFALAGDLESVGSELAGRFGTVVHCAADVSFVKDYAALAPVNVEGTRRILDLCAEGAVLHHVSSLSVFSDQGREYLPETTPLPVRPPARGGYAQSKWAAENLVRSFAASGGQAHIHRLPIVIDRRFGADDYMGALVRGCRETGAFPDVDVDLPVVRRRLAAAAIAASLGMPPRTWHLQESTAPTVRELATAAGAMEALPPEQWLRRVERAVAETAGHPLAPYLDVLRASRRNGVLDPAGPSGGRLDGRDSWRRLAQAGVEAGTTLEALLRELI